MGRSRYAGNRIIGDHYGTWRNRVSENYLGGDILEGVDTIMHSVTAGERLDILASRYYGDEENWWIIALANQIMFPLLLTPGRKLRIPTDVKQILSKLQR